MSDPNDGFPEFQLSRENAGQLWVNGFGDICEIALCEDMSLPLQRPADLAYVVKEENHEHPYKSRRPVVYWPVLIINNNGLAFHFDRSNPYNLVGPLEVGCPF